MPSATTADSNDSIPPSRAMATAEGSSATSWLSETLRQAGTGRPRGTPPNFEPMVSTGMSKAQTAQPASAIAASSPGKRGFQIRRIMMKASDAAASPKARGRRPKAGPKASSLGRKAAGSCSRAAPAVLDLAREDDDGDARGEADGHGIGDIFDVDAEPRITDRD